MKQSRVNQIFNGVCPRNGLKKKRFTSERPLRKNSPEKSEDRKGILGPRNRSR